MRECKECNTCCEGWLFGEAHGHFFQPGRPCHFKCEGGCSIYENRPVNPCQNYNCEWLLNNDIPEWMKPNKCGSIITKREWSKGHYLEVHETGKKIDSTVLNWIFMYHYTTDVPIRVQVGGGWNNYGPREFLKEVGGIRASKEG